MNGEDHIKSFVGQSPREGATDEEPTLEAALVHAAEQASNAGYAGKSFAVAIELIPERHNQYVRTYSATITPHPHP